MADVVENEAKMAYMKSSGPRASSMDEPRGPSKGFVVREAPWTTGSAPVSQWYSMSGNLLLSKWLKLSHRFVHNTNGGIEPVVFCFRLRIWAALRNSPVLVHLWPLQGLLHGDPSVFKTCVLQWLCCILLVSLLLLSLIWPIWMWTDHFLWSPVYQHSSSAQIISASKGLDLFSVTLKNKTGGKRCSLYEGWSLPGSPELVSNETTCLHF